MRSHQRPAMARSWLISSRALPASVQRSLSSPHHLAGHGHVEAGGGFVGDHQGGMEGHGQGDGQALAHAAAEFVGIAAVALRGDAHPGQQLPGRPAGGRGRPGPATWAGAPQGVAQVLADGEQGVEPGHRVLEHQAHRFAPQPPQGGAPQAAGILACQEQVTLAAAAGGQQLQHRPGHRALAAARGTHQGQAFARAQAEIQAVQGGFAHCRGTAPATPRSAAPVPGWGRGGQGHGRRRRRSVWMAEPPYLQVGDECPIPWVNPAGCDAESGA